MIYARRCNFFCYSVFFTPWKEIFQKFLNFCEIIVDKSRSIGYNNKALFKCTK